MQAIAKPLMPRLLPQLEVWGGRVANKIEAEGCAVGDVDFSVAKRFEAEACRFSATSFAAAKFEKLHISDSVLERVEAAGMQAPDSAWLRVEVTNSRLTGVDLGAGLLEDCVFMNVKLDEAGLRFATLKRVKFESCVLRGLDFSGAKLTDVSFDECELDGTNFDNTICKNVDLRSENLAAIKGVQGLRGATVSSEQLIQLAPLLSAEAGLDVVD